MSQLSPASSSSALLEEATSTAAGAQRRLADLRSFQIPRLEGCKSLGIHAELCEELRGDLEHVRRSVEICAELCEYISPRARDEFEHTLTALTQEYKELQTAYRNAVVLSKSLIDSRARSKRHLTNRDSTGDTLESEEPDKPRPAAGTDDALQTKTNEVTDALRRTTNLMQAELERSVLSVQMLDSSTQTLKLTSGLYDNYSSLLQTSTQLIRLIEKADWYDRLIILSAFVLFLLVVGWILKRRVLDKLVGGVGWWVGGSFRLLGMGMGLGSSKTSKVKGASSLASAAVSSVGPAASAALAAAANRRKVPLEGLDQKKDLNQDQGLSLEESQKARSTSTGQPHEDLVPSPPEDSAVRPAGDGAPRDEL